MTFIVIVILIGLLPAAIAHGKGGNFLLWWFYGSMIFIVALPHAILKKPDTERLEAQQLLSGKMRKCPYCAELIKLEASVCRYCGRDLEADDHRSPSATPSLPLTWGSEGNAPTTPSEPGGDVGVT